MALSAPSSAARDEVPSFKQGVAPPTLRSALHGKKLPPTLRADEIVLSSSKSQAEDDSLSIVAPSEAASTVVVPDPIPMKRIPPNVLREDDYADAVSELIERDFFPDLPLLRLKSELYKALVNGDEDQVLNLQWQLANLQRPTPASTPLASPNATPLRMPDRDRGGSGAAASGSGDRGGRGSTDAEARLSAWERDDDLESFIGTEADRPGLTKLKTVSGKEILLDLSTVRLDDFQRVFTSEDNASFEKILARDTQLKKDKLWWIEAMEKKHNTEHKAHVKALANGPLPPGTEMHHEFKGRHALGFHQESIAQEGIQKPRVDVKNTRFTTQQQQELDNMLQASFMAREARLKCERVGNAYEQMAVNGKFKQLSTFINAMKVKELRAIDGRLESPLPGGYDKNASFPILTTPDLIPGEGNLSPLMTYGKLGSTPRLLSDDSTKGPNFVMQETSQREEAADKLQRSALQKQRESKQAAKAERLRALGITPTGTPKSAKSTRSTPGSSRPTPSSVMSKVTPMSPIGQLIHRAQKLAQRGGQLGISSGRGGASGRSVSASPAGVGASPAPSASSWTGGGGAAEPAAKRSRHVEYLH